MFLLNTQKKKRARKTASIGKKYTHARTRTKQIKTKQKKPHQEDVPGAFYQENRRKNPNTSAVRWCSLVAILYSTSRRCVEGKGEGGWWPDDGWSVLRKNSAVNQRSAEKCVEEEKKRTDALRFPLPCVLRWSLIETGWWFSSFGRVNVPRWHDNYTSERVPWKHGQTLQTHFRKKQVILEFTWRSRVSIIWGYTTIFSSTVYHCRHTMILLWYGPLVSTRS